MKGIDMGGSRRLVVGAVVMALLGAAGMAGHRGADAADEQEQITFGALPQTRAGQTRTTATQALEAEIGRKLEAVRVFETWSSAFPDSFHTFLRDGGRTPILSVKTLRGNGTRLLWADLANAAPGSQLDNEMRSWARRIRDYGAPIYVSLNHEPEASASSSMGTSAEYIAAWRRWVTVFREEGADNAKFMWIMTAYSFSRPASDRRQSIKWYPGDEWVDALGADAYNWAECRQGAEIAWQSLEEIIEPFRQFGLQHPTEPLWLAEWGSWDDPGTPGRQAQWITDARELFKRPSHSQFVGVSYFNSPHTGSNYPDCDWWMDSTAASLAAFTAMGADPLYQGDPDATGGPVNQAPTASIAAGCTLEACTFDGSGSTDADGTVQSWSWEFGDGTTATGETPAHVYAFAGTYTVTLTVTDDDGATGTTTQELVVDGTPPPPNEAPTASFTASCTNLTCSFDSAASTDVDGAILSRAWSFGDGAGAAGVTANRTYATGGTYTVTLTVTDDDGATGTSTQQVTVTAPVTPISFVASAMANANATTHRVTVPAAVRQGDGLILVVSVNTTATINTPTGVTGWQVLNTVTAGSTVTRVYRKVAGATDAGRAVSIGLSAQSKANVVVAAYRGTSATDPVAAFSGVRETVTRTAHPAPAATVASGRSWVVSYWSHKDATTNALVAPAEVAVRASGTQSGSGRVTGLLVDTAGAAPAGSYAAGSATGATAVNTATMWTIVLAPA